MTPYVKLYGDDLAQFIRSLIRSSAQRNWGENTSQSRADLRVRLCDQQHGKFPNGRRINRKRIARKNGGKDYATIGHHPREVEESLQEFLRRVPNPCDELIITFITELNSENNLRLEPVRKKCHARKRTG